jgi:hypothetical protein
LNEFQDGGETKMLNKAIAVAGHSWQKDRYGFPYILHPIRLMMKTCPEEGDLPNITGHGSGFPAKIRNLKKR